MQEKKQILPKQDSGSEVGTINKKKGLSDDRWDVNLRDTVLRESVLSWYEFRPDADLLEIGAGHGERTGLYLRRVRSVTSVVFTEEEEIFLSGRYPDAANLTVIRGSLPPVQKFDYIIVMGSDPITDLLRTLNIPVMGSDTINRLLRAGGILILGADNRYGLKYFCGAGESCTGIPFMGINGYHEALLQERKPEGRLYSRQEWEEILKKAGFSTYRFYYPVPDMRMPQLIFTDRYQKGVNAAERLVDYDYSDPSMTGLEHRIFRDMIDGGALPFMANSFLIEVGQNTAPEIDYAVVTADRGPGKGMATTIRSNGKVYKRPLWKQGEENLRMLAQYTEELASKGVPVVPAVLRTDRHGLYLEMPYIDREGLSPVLERAAEEDPEKFLRIFDEIYAYIRMSFTPQRNDPESGRIFLDLAPCNCFYAENPSLLFYDQEFVMEDGNPEFAMFRTIKYFFASSPGAREKQPLKDMYRRYGITDEMLEEFEKKEEAFIRSVRNMDRYQWLMKASTPDYERISGNMRRDMEKKASDPEKPYHIGYVPGVFDLFHTGHLRLLERCKERCDHLIVGVLTDELAAYYKGKPPVISCENRMRVIGGLRCVDEVIPVDFHNTDKLDAWEQLHYDCHFSGDDHVGHWNDVLEKLRKRGSNMEFFSYTQGISSTQIKEELSRE